PPPSMPSWYRFICASSTSPRERLASSKVCREIVAPRDGTTPRDPVVPAWRLIAVAHASLSAACLDTPVEAPADVEADAEVASEALTEVDAPWARDREALAEADTESEAPWDREADWDSDCPWDRP